jgi:hypothetical protein
MSAAQKPTCFRVLWTCKQDFPINCGLLPQRAIAEEVCLGIPKIYWTERNSLSTHLKTLP